MGMMRRRTRRRTMMVAGGMAYAAGRGGGQADTYADAPPPTYEEVPPAPPPPAQTAPSPADEEMDQIQKLADLHAAGTLTDEEFAAAKAQLLGLGSAPAAQ